jgi:hypothetical protein
MVGGAKKTGSTGLNLAVSPTLSKLIFPDVLTPDHVVPIYKNSQPVNITSLYIDIRQRLWGNSSEN